jgi:uncharacterized protein YjbI with pentapeptide repeats
MADESQSARGLSEVPAADILATIEKGKPVEYVNILINGDLDFSIINIPSSDSGKKIVTSPIKISDSKIKGKVDFSETIFKKSIDFGRTIFFSEAYFDGVIFNQSAKFESVDFMCGCRFFGVVFEGMAVFDSAVFGEKADFRKTTITKFKRDTKEVNWVDKAKESIHAIYFVRSVFKEGIDLSDTLVETYGYLNKAKLKGLSDFNNSSFGQLIFDGAEIQDISLNDLKVKNLSFYNTQFLNPVYQRNACGLAKRLFEEKSDKEDADYYYFREMAAKRVLNGLPTSQEWLQYIDDSPIAFENFAANKIELVMALKGAIVFLDFDKIVRFLRYNLFEYIFIQVIFGYGTHPFWLMGWWGVFVVLFAIIYWHWHGIIGASEFMDFLWVSLTTAVTPGFSGYKPAPGFQWIAGIEAILGTFMWAAFIATFARKYMR